MILELTILRVFFQMFWLLNSNIIKFINVTKKYELTKFRFINSIHRVRILNTLFNNDKHFTWAIKNSRSIIYQLIYCRVF